MKKRLLCVMITVPVFDGQNHLDPSRPLCQGPAVIAFAYTLSKSRIGYSHLCKKPVLNHLPLCYGMIENWLLRTASYRVCVLPYK